MTPSRLTGLFLLFSSIAIASSSPASAGVLDPSIPALSQMSDGIDDVKDDVVGEAVSIKELPANKHMDQATLKEMQSDQADYEIAYRALASSVNHYYRNLESAVMQHKHIDMTKYDAAKNKIIPAANREQSLGDAFIRKYKYRATRYSRPASAMNLLKVIFPTNPDPLDIWKKVQSLSDSERQTLAKDIKAAEWPGWDDLTDNQSK